MADKGAVTQTALDIESGIYRIGEVSRMTGVKAFVLRYWETEFPMLEPEKRSNGRRFYRQEDVDLILKIKRLLYGEGFTVAGARRHLRGGGTAGTGFEKGGAGGPGDGAAALLDPQMLLGYGGMPRGFFARLGGRRF